MAEYDSRILARFWSKVDKVSSGTGCWLWTAATKEGRYGAFKLPTKVERSHRVSWMISNGPIPEKMHVLHRCDVPLCVNPSHLFLGTHKENMCDMRAKERHHVPDNRRYTQQTIDEIAGLKGQCFQRLAAERFGVSQTFVSAVWRNVHRRHTYASNRVS